MQEARLAFFESLLKERKQALLAGAEKTVDGLTQQPGHFPDPNDRATQESDHIFNLRIRDRERKLIAKIDEALERIKDGSFGICEECGKDIPESRLQVRPVTTLCIKCKEKQEAVEKKLGI